MIKSLKLSFGSSLFAGPETQARHVTPDDSCWAELMENVGLSDDQAVHIEFDIKVPA
jgi:hypothetical protein